MREINLIVENEHIKGYGVPVGAAGSHDAVGMRLTFSSIWRGLTKRVLWIDARGATRTETVLTSTYAVTLDEYVVPIPAAPLQYPGRMSMTIYGVEISGGDEVLKIVTEAVYFPVMASFYDPDNAPDGPLDIDPTIADQLQAELDDVLGDILAGRVFENYDSTKRYVVGNKVAYQGSSYVCIRNTPGNRAPTHTSYWLMIAQRGADSGEISGSTLTPLNGVLFGNGTNLTAKALDSTGGAASAAAEAETRAMIAMTVTVTPVPTSLFSGDYFIWNGKLYQAWQDLNTGWTPDPGTNCGEMQVGSALSGFERVDTGFRHITDALAGDISPLLEQSGAAPRRAYYVEGDCLLVAEAEPVGGDMAVDTPVLHRATSYIAHAGTVSPGTNCKESNLADELRVTRNTIDSLSGCVAGKNYGTTADRAYAIGEYFVIRRWVYGFLSADDYLETKLYRATSAISAGGTIAPGTNCVEVTTGGELFTNIGYNVRDNSYFASASGVVFRMGRVVFISLKLKVGTSGLAYNTRIIDFPGVPPIEAGTKAYFNVDGFGDHTTYETRINGPSGNGAMYTNEAIPASALLQMNTFYITT